MSLREDLEKFVREEVCPVNENLVPGFVSGACDGWGRARNRVAKILQENPPGIPDDAVCYFQEDGQWSCVFADYPDSRIGGAAMKGRGAHSEDAMRDLRDKFSKFKDEEFGNPLDTPPEHSYNEST